MCHKCWRTEHGHWRECCLWLQCCCFEILCSLAESRTNPWFGQKQVDSHWLNDAFLHIGCKHVGQNSDNFSVLFSGVEEKKMNLLFQKMLIPSRGKWEIRSRKSRKCLLHTPRAMELATRICLWLRKLLTALQSYKNKPYLSTKEGF